MYRLSSIPAARRWVWRLVVICAAVSASSPFSPPSTTLGNRNLDPSANGPLHGLHRLLILDHGYDRFNFATIEILPYHHRL